ncbi:MAG: hypothetical protein HFJ47_00055 [Clostridia bacterium]|nr:hypothetical protein [Clostridia bacterium]
MGQRLNIEIKNKEKVLANCYYHWSGFANSAVNLTIEIIRNFEYIRKYETQNVKNKELLFAIRLLEETGAGTQKSEIDNTIKEIGLIDENIKLKESKGRNEGIIEISEEGMKENRYWEEARVTIDIENKTVNFNAIREIEKEEKQEYEDDGTKFVDINIDFKNIKFEDIFNLKAFIDKSCYEEQYYFKNKFDDKYIHLIQ